MKDLIIVHSDEYRNWVFDPTHPTQGRRFINGYDAIRMHAEAAGLQHETITPTAPADRELLETVHTSRYVSEVLDEHKSREWAGQRPDMSHLASLFVGGTMVGLRELLSGNTMTAVNLPGAKHHAQADSSSGFCVFADFAIAAHTVTDLGLRVAVLDVDAHHGDGTQNLTYDNSDIMTYSIHQWGIFPGTGLGDDPDKHVFNWPLQAWDGDRALRQGVLNFVDEARRFKPHMLFVAGGADGHAADPLSDLTFTLKGYEEAMRIVRNQFPDTPVLFGGAGGYAPDGATPLAWARMVTALAS